MREFMKVAKALSDETRVRILAMLRFGELCVCDIIDVLELAPSTVSKHLSILYQAHLINARKEGKWIYYRISEDAPDSASRGIKWVLESVSEEVKVKDDKAKLRKVKRAYAEK